MVDVLFQRYEISDECLGKLTVDQRAMFAVLCLTVSEVDAMKKALTLGPSAPVGDEDLDAAFISQKTVFMRMIGMKILEAFKTLMLSKKENFSDDAGLNTFRRNHVLRAYNELKKIPGGSVVQQDRNKLGFHYDLERFRELVQRSRTNAEHSILVAKEFEFQSFPFGEISVASGHGNSAAAFCLSEARKSVEENAEFVRQAMRKFSVVFQAFFETFLRPHLKSEQIEKSVPDMLVARRNRTAFPLFVFPEATQ
ncbi:MAG: hypothetical protein QNK42_04885 [Pseudodonghicola sp.]|nr:hypothetical protein [Pseudodonghicola sp.]